jgi:putative flippase GtrA
VLESLGAKEWPVSAPAPQRAVEHRAEPTPKSGRGNRCTKFCLLGALVFAAGTALQWQLVHPLGADVSYLAQTMFSVELSYVLNRLWAWGDRETRGALRRWNVRRAGIAVLNLLGYDLLLRWYGMNWRPRTRPPWPYSRWSAACWQAAGGLRTGS